VATYRHIARYRKNKKRIHRKNDMVINNIVQEKTRLQPTTSFRTNGIATNTIIIQQKTKL